MGLIMWHCQFDDGPNCDWREFFHRANVMADSYSDVWILNIGRIDEFLWIVR